MELFEFIWFLFFQSHESLMMKLLKNMNVSFTISVQAYSWNTHFRLKGNSWLISPFQNHGIYSRDSLLAFYFFSKRQHLVTYICNLTFSSWGQSWNPFQYSSGQEILFSEEIKVEQGFQEWPLFLYSFHSL